MRKMMISVLVLSLLFSGMGMLNAVAYDWSEVLTSTTMGSDDSGIYKGISLAVLAVAVGVVLWLGWQTDREGVETIQVVPEKSEIPLLFVDLGDFSDEDLADFQQKEAPVDLAGRVGLRLYF